MRIYKYEILKGAGDQFVQIPANSYLLKVGMQLINHDNRIFLWASVDPEATIVECRFRVVPTGDKVPHMQYIDTVFDGPFVRHIFADPSVNPVRAQID